MVIMAITRGMVRRKDRLSALSDDLLSSEILAKIPPREAMRCSLLSRRWRYLWRNELSQDSRQKIVNKIMDTFQRHMPFTGPDGMNELRKIALRFEEKVYAAAGDQQDYLRKISLKMTQQQKFVEQQKQLLQAQNQRLSGVPTTSVESSGQIGQSNATDQQEKIYQKLLKIKDIYFPDLRELLQRLTVKCQQPMAADQLEKLKVYRGKVLRMMQYFQVSKNNIPPGFPEDKIDAVERQIQYVVNSFKPGKLPTA